MPQLIRLPGLVTRLTYSNPLGPGPVYLTGTALLGFPFRRLLAPTDHHASQHDSACLSLAISTSALTRFSTLPRLPGFYPGGVSLPVWRYEATSRITRLPGFGPPEDFS